MVTNTGSVSLSALQVTDDQGLTVSCPDTVLDPGETMTCTASAAATAGQHVDLATATGEPPCGEPVSSVLVGLTGTLELPPLPREQAGAELDRLIDAWLEGMRRPLPVACKAAFAWLAAGEDADRASREANP